MRNASKLLILVFLAFSNFTSAQFTKRCGTTLAMQKTEETQPGYIQSTKNLFADFYSQNNSRAISDTFLYVRVVVHVVYNTTAENLADSVILNQIGILNNDFGRMNADTINMRAVFAPIAGVDARIRFLLADTDPQGNPTNGITRTSTTKTTFFSLGGGGLAEDVKSTSNGGVDPWDQTRYLNIWVCDMSIPFIGPAVLGYATPPNGLPNWDAGSTAGISDGVVIQYEAFGSNNPNPLSAAGTTFIVKGRTPVHEVGHYLGLRHIWGDATNCTGDDGILDTPQANDASAQDCDTSKNSCTDNIAGIDMPDMIENFMDYSAEDCQNSFTKSQVEFMRWVILTKRQDVATVSFTTINEIRIEETFVLAPNPANEYFNIVALKGNKILNVKLYSADGMLVLSDACNNGTAIINTMNLPQGIYFVEVASKNNVQRMKLLIAH